VISVVSHRASNFLSLNKRRSNQPTLDQNECVVQDSFLEESTITLPVEEPNYFDEVPSVDEPTAVHEGSDDVPCVDVRKWEGKQTAQRK